MAFHRVSGHSIYVDRSDHVYRSAVTDPLGSSRIDGMWRGHRTMGVSGDGARKPSGLSGGSSTWKVDYPWAIPLGEASHVHQCVVDHAGMGC